MLKNTAARLRVFRSWAGGGVVFLVFYIGGLVVWRVYVRTISNSTFNAKDFHRAARAFTRAYAVGRIVAFDNV